MLGKIVPFLLVGYVQMTVILLLGRLLFHVPIRGSLLLLYVVALPLHRREPGHRALHLDAGPDPGPGDAARVLLPHAEHPALGIHVPPRGDAGRWPSGSALALPLTYFLDVLRGIMLKGVGFDALWHQFLAMWGFAVLVVFMSVRRFHKTLE